MITDLGSLSLSAIVPGADAACAIAAPNAAAQLAALASFTPQVSLSIAAQITIVENMLAALNVALTAVPPIPILDLSAQVALALDVAAAIQAQLDIIVGLQTALDTAGVRLLAYDGQQDLLGSELATALGASTTHCNALVISTTSGAAWTSMGAILKTS